MSSDDEWLEIKAWVSAGVSFEPQFSAAKLLREMNAANLVCALAAILFWSLVIGAVSCCYELWRLDHNWRLGIA